MSQPIWGFIKANGGDTPRAASTIFYDVIIDVPNAGPVEYQHVRPCGKWKDDKYDVMPREPGFMFPVRQAAPGAAMEFQFDEEIAYDVCSNSAARSSDNRILRDASGKIIPPGGGGQNQGGGGPPGGGVGGGGPVTR